jgi:hypothetical protein
MSHHCHGATLSLSAMATSMPNLPSEALKEAYCLRALACSSLSGIMALRTWASEKSRSGGCWWQWLALVVADRAHYFRRLIVPPPPFCTLPPT